MSRRNLGGFIRPGYNPLRVPNAPTIGTASQASATSVSVPFTAPSCVGGGAITGYTAVSSPGCKIGTGSASPITVSCLTTGTAYTFRVYATNSYGPSAYSASSNSVTPAAVGQQAYTTAGSYTWVAPSGVTSVSIVAIGGGAGGYGNVSGAGGELRYINNVSVTPGNSYSVTVGAGGCHNLVGNQCHGKPSTFSTVVQANGGGVQNSWPCCGTVKNWQTTSGFGGTGYVGGQGRTGGSSAGGGGAGGYSGTGGAGGPSLSGGSGGTGGAGGGGAGNYPYCGCIGSFIGGGGGGTGILGQGSSGAGGTYSGACCGTATGGGGGSGGSAGQTGKRSNTGNGGLYGGGGGASGNGNIAGYGAAGAVRIIWPGTTRQFPSTCTGDK